MSLAFAHSPERSTAYLQIATGRMKASFPCTFSGMPFDRLVAGGVLVAVFALDDWRACAADAFKVLDARERDRVQRQRQEKHRNSLTLAYALHRFVLANVMGLSAERVPLARDVRGRPLLEGEPIETSLSHADDYAAVAISMHGPVGVDIEPIHRATVMPDIAERICHRDELTRIATLDDAGQRLALLDLWVRKEAFLKAAGVGLAREMETFALPEGRAHALHHGQPPQVVVDLLDLGPTVACAVARSPGQGCISGWVRPAQAGG